MAEEANNVDLPPVEDAGLREELTKLEDEINTLKQVLQSKEQQAAEMRRKLGIGPIQQIRSTFENIGKSETVQKTSATLTEVGDATGKAFSAFGSSVSTKFSEMKFKLANSKIRSSPSFQSFEQKVGGMFRANSRAETPTATTPSEPPKQDAPL